MAMNLSSERLINGLLMNASVSHSSFNESESESDLSPLGYDIAAVCLALIFVFGAINNLIVIVAILRNKKLRTPMNVILLNLSISDFTISVIGTPMTFISAVYREWFFGSTACHFYGFAMTLSGSGEKGKALKAMSLFEQSRIFERKILHFCSVTGVTRWKAIELLKKSKWNYNEAIANLYDGNGRELDTPTSRSPPKRDVKYDVYYVKVMANREQRQREFENAVEAGNFDDLREDRERTRRFWEFQDVEAAPVQYVQVRPVRHYSNDPNRVITDSIGHLFKQLSEKYPRGRRGIEDPDDTQQGDVEITFWNNGFTVGEGPLRAYDDPENADFLESIQKFETPQELISPYNPKEVKVSVQNRCEEVFFPEVGQANPFSGRGQKLGSSSDEQHEDPEDEASTSSSAPCLELDEYVPITLLRIRLIDGTQMTLRVNLTHTIDDIKKYLSSVRSPSDTEAFILMASFPPTPLEGHQTIEDANLMNSIVVQKYRE